MIELVLEAARRDARECLGVSYTVWSLEADLNVLWSLDLDEETWIG